MTQSTQTISAGLIGARGYTGAELVQLLNSHPLFKLELATSRDLAGQHISNYVDQFDSELIFEDISPEEIASRKLDVIVLAMPNEASFDYIKQIDLVSPESVIIDLSADHRFDDSWAYGLPEHFRDLIRAKKRIANPGCYATAMQLAIRPMLDLLSGPPHVFGVSGYSGAGTKPSDKNDPEKLRDNLMPYSLVGHIHEHEVSHHLGQKVRFHPHVAPFFRGITLTVSMQLNSNQTIEDLSLRYHQAYDDEPLVDFLKEIPLVKDIALTHFCSIGGLTIDNDLHPHAVVVATIDNLLKGAATQAIQNMNLACDLDEFAGLSV